MPQTGFIRPVKIIADKDTTKHRTKQVVCIVTFVTSKTGLCRKIHDLFIKLLNLNVQPKNQM